MAIIENCSPDYAPFNTAQGAYASAVSTANTAVQSANNMIQAITTAAKAVSEIPDARAHYSFAPTPLEPLVIPTIPDTPDTAVALMEYPDVSSVQAPSISVGSVPQLSVSIPESVAGSPPPGASYDAPEMPSLPSYTAPSLPNVETVDVPVSSIVIPDVPEIPEVLFDDPFPENTQLMADLNLDLSGVTPVSHDLSGFDLSRLVPIQASLATLVEDLMNGSRTTVLKVMPGVNDAVLQRAKGREAGNDLREQEAALSSFARRGFSRPPGALAAALSRLQQAVEMRNSTLIQGLAIEELKEEREDFRWAFETLAKATNDLFKFQVDMVDAFVKVPLLVFDAQTKYWEWQKNNYLLQVEAHKEKRNDALEILKLNLATLERTKVQLDAAKTAGVLYATDVDLYAQQVAATRVDIERYAAQVNGAKAEVEAGANIVQAYRAQVEAAIGEVQAAKVEAEIYATMVDADKSNAAIYEAQVRAYAAEVEGYSAGINAKIAVADGKTKLEGLKIEAYKAKIDAIGAQNRLELERVQALISVFSGQARMFEAQVNAEAARASVDAKSIELDAKLAEVDSNFTLQEAQINITKAINTAKLAMDSAIAAANVAAQVASSSMASVNASVSASGSAGSSSSCTTYKDITTLTE